MYGRIVDGRFEKAPNCIKNDFNLSAEKYLEAGYLPVVEEAPNPPEGMEPSYREYVEDGGKIFSDGSTVHPLRHLEFFRN